MSSSLRILAEFFADICIAVLLIVLGMLLAGTTEDSADTQLGILPHGVDYRWVDSVLDVSQLAAEAGSRLVGSSGLWEYGPHDWHNPTSFASMAGIPAYFAHVFHLDFSSGWLASISSTPVSQGKSTGKKWRQPLKTAKGKDFFSPSHLSKRHCKPCGQPKEFTRCWETKICGRPPTNAGGFLLRRAFRFPSAVASPFACMVIGGIRWISI